MTAKIHQIRNNFYKFTTERPVAILMVVIGFFVFGLISYQELPLNLMPDMAYPSLTVRTEYDGTAPEEIETTISRPVEQALGVIDNLVTISSVSKAEQSDIILEFTWDTDMNNATADVREKLDQVFLPDDAKRPIILRYDPSLDPIIRIGLYGEAGLTRLRYIGEEQIKRTLETIDGVAAVKVKGGLEEEIRVELDEQKLTLINMNIQTINARLAEENVNLAGGNLKEGETEYLVRTLNEFKTIDEIRNVIIGRYNNVDIKIKDIGNVYRTSKEREIITRIDGEESVEIEIYKEADANIVSVAERIKAKLYGTPEQQAFIAEKKRKAEKKEPEKKEQKQQHGGRGGSGIDENRMTNFLTYDIPDGAKIKTLSDQSLFIESSINEVKNTAVVGGILAIIVLFLFLRQLGPTLIIGLSIPISIIATFAPMKIFDVSLNIMSLGGLALGIGMLVDNSIVVLESIARCRDEGDELIRATIRGVSEVGSAVTASTLTTIAVFFPIVFVQGVAGQVFGDMALTIVFSLLASLAAALFLIPMLSSRRTSTFVGGADITKIPKDYILNISVKNKVDYLFAENNEGGFFGNLISGFLLVFKVTISWLWHSLKVFGALILVFAKEVSLILLVFLQPLAGLAKIVFRRLKLGDFVKKYAASSASESLPFTAKIWNNFLALESVSRLYGGFLRTKEKFLEKSFMKKVLYTPAALIRLFFYLIAYFAAVMLEMVFRVFHSFSMLLGLFLYWIILILRLLFTAPVGWMVAGFDLIYSFTEKAYPKILEKALDNQTAVIGGAAGLFLLTALFIAPNLGSELIPEVHQGEFYVELQLPVGTPVEKTDQRVLPIQEKILAIPGVLNVAEVSGTDKSSTSETEEGEHTCKLTVTMKPASNLAAAEEKIIKEIRKTISGYPGIYPSISRPTIFSFKTPIEVYIKGYNLGSLQKYSQELEKRMSEIEGLVDVRSNIQRGNPEVQIYYNRKILSHYNLNIMNVASIVRNKVKGDVATEYKEADRRIDILVRLREEDKESLNDLRKLVINPNDPIPIPLEAVADIRVKEGPSEILRTSQQRSAMITANIAPGYNMGELNVLIFDEIENLNLPNDFNYEIAGQNQEMETSINSLMLALGLAIFLVYIVMASQFESLIHPFIIIFTIPLAVIGVLIFLYFFKIPISIVVFLGMIMLAGIVVNNAIVLVDYINHLRRRGLEKIDAIKEAGKVRLRPILMTTLTTVLGLLPMALGLGDGAEIRTPMAVTVIFGLLSSTILTLVVIPTVYNLLAPAKIALAEVMEDDEKIG